MNKALFLDRDGIINVDRAYVYQPQNFIFIDGIFDLCRYFVHHGYHLFIVTNQAGIGRGFYTEEAFATLTTWVHKQFSQQAITIKKTYYCPHHPTVGLGVYKTSCLCRKPQTGMLLAAAHAFNLELTQSILIGDKTSDIKAGKSAGLHRTYLIKSRYQTHYDFSSIQQMTQYLKRMNDEI